MAAAGGDGGESLVGLVVEVYGDAVVGGGHGFSRPLSWALLYDD